MSESELKKVNERIQRLLIDAVCIAEDALVTLCREVMVKHQDIRECCIAMGTVAFYDLETGQPLWHDDPRVQRVEDFVSAWDSNLALTGYPKRFDATGPVATDW